MEGMDRANISNKNDYQWKEWTWQTSATKMSSGERRIECIMNKEIYASAVIDPFNQNMWNVKAVDACEQSSTCVPADKDQGCTLCSPGDYHGKLHSFQFWRNSDGTEEFTLDNRTVNTSLLGTLKRK